MGQVVSVNASAAHGFSKQPQGSILLLQGQGVAGDAHCGALVQHLYKMKKDPTQPNLCQVHLLQSELFAEPQASSFNLAPGEMGENITTAGLDLLNLPTGTLLRLGPEAIVEVTGLRSPCVQIDRHKKGLLAAMVVREPRRKVLRKAGIMSIVLTGGSVHPGDRIDIVLPAKPYRALVCV